MREVTDTDEWCVNCGKPVLSYHRKCPWCGKSWDVKETTDFAKRLLQLKEEYGKTFKEIAEETGITRTSLTAWCRSEAMPNSKSLMILCKYFDVSADWLLGLNNFRKVKR